MKVVDMGTIRRRSIPAFAFTILLMVFSFLPSRFNASLAIGNWQLPITQWLLLLYCVILAPCLIPVSKRLTRTKLVIILYIIILMLGLISLVGSDVPSESITDAISNLILSLCAMGTALIAAKNTFQLNRWIVNISRVLGIAFIIYSADSVFQLGLSHSLVGVDARLGIRRVAGPLGGAAVLHTIIVPTLSVLVGSIREQREKRGLLDYILVIGVSVTAVLTGSRTAVGILLLWVILVTLFDSASIRAIAGRIVGIVVVSTVSLAVVPVLDRFTNLQDTSRYTTHLVGWKLATENLISFLFGSGYGSVWYVSRPAFHLDASTYWIDTSYGPILGHSHSVPLELLVEFGFIAFLAFVAICGLLFLGFRRHASNLLLYLHLAVVATIPGFAIDLYFLANWRVTTIWWFFAFVVLLGSRANGRDPTMPGEEQTCTKSDAWDGMGMTS